MLSKMWSSLFCLWCCQRKLIFKTIYNHDKLFNFSVNFKVTKITDHIICRTPRPVAEFKEFERRFKFKPRFKYCWFHLKLYQMFGGFRPRLKFFKFHLSSLLNQPFKMEYLTFSRQNAMLIIDNLKVGT